MERPEAWLGGRRRHPLAGSPGPPPSARSSRVGTKPVAELQWLTTWGHDANPELRALLDLPTLLVAGTYQDEDGEGAVTTTGTTSHAAAAPSAPDPLSGQWWKYDVVRRVLSEQPDRQVLCVDDELQPGTALRRWADDQPNLSAIGPDPAVGLRAADLAAMVVVMEQSTA